MSKKILVALMVLGVLGCGLRLKAEAADIYVPGSYTTIQGAINAASNGDRVLVNNGIYTESINFSGKTITVQSVHGTTSTIIDGNASGSVVTFNSGEGTGSVLSGFTIRNETADGGGIYCYYSSPTITNCTISGNSAGYAGGGIYCNYSSPMLTDCTISGNSAYYGGGICCDYSSPMLTNCIISGNSSYRGGGICCGFSSSPTITNCTISGNSTSDSGGGIWCYDSLPRIVNSILWGNNPQEISLAGDSSINITYSDIKGGYAGTGNINADPLFVGVGNFNLQSTSPCINTGSNTAPFIPSTDKDGNPRIYNNVTVDMGAYEYQGAPPQPTQINIIPTSGTVGSIVTVSGNGYIPTEMIRLDFGMCSAIGTTISGANGTFSTIFIADTQPCGSTTIRATGLSSGKTANAVFFILPRISAIPVSGTVGCTVTVAGNGYMPNEMIRFAFGTTPTIVSVYSNVIGTFSTCFTTDTQPYGTTTVAAYGNISGICAASTFAMKANIICLTPTTGTVGTYVTISGNGFGSNESIRVNFGTISTITLGTTSSYGNFAITFTVNTQPYGITTITIISQSSLAEARTSFNICSSIVMISPISGSVGTVVRIMSNGFGANELIRISLGHTATINITTANETGSFDTSFTVDTQPAGTTTIMASGVMTGQMAAYRFFIMPSTILLTPTQGTVGSWVTIAGNGFGANESLRINFGTTLTICSVNSNADGTFIAVFTADIQSYGTTAVRITGLTPGFISSAYFRILPHIILISPKSGQIGARITVAGNGFGSGETVAIDFGNTNTIAVTNTMVNGNFQLIFTANAQPMGTTTLIARGQITNAMDTDRFMLRSSVTMKITPSTQNIVKGEEFSSQIEIVNVSQLVSADIYIDFNPDILEAISVGSGTFMPNCSAVTLIDTGTIKYSFGLMAGSGTGSGVLCYLQFRAKERGISDVTINSQTKLYTERDETAVEIPFAKEDASYYVISGLRIQPQNRVMRADEYIAYQCISDGDLLIDITGSTIFTASGGGDFNGNVFHAKNMGTHTIMAAYLGLTCTTSAIITPGTPTALSYVSGNNQTNTCTLTLNEPFVVKVVDVYNNPCPGVDIGWQVIHTPSGATEYFISPTMTTTNIYGMASSSMTLGTEPPGTYAISAVSSGLSGSPVSFTASSLRRFGNIAGFCVLRLGLNRYGTHCSDIQVKILETGATMTTDSNSYFAFNHIPVGIYTLKFDTWGASCATLNTVNISPIQFEDTTYIGTMSLLAGDVSDDGGVDASDWPLFAYAWRKGATPAKPDWLNYREADFDHNQAVLSPDFIILRNNFNKTQGLFGGLRAPSMSGVQPWQEAIPLRAKASSSGQINLSFDLSTLEGVDINDLRVGNTIYLKITISEATDFMAGEVHLSFNPDVLEAIDSLPKVEGINIQPGTYPTGDVYSLINNADNNLGKIDYAVGMIDPQTGDGGLFAVIPFRIKAYGVTAKVGFDFAPEKNGTTKFVEAPNAIDNKPVDLINLSLPEVIMEKHEVSVVIPMRYSNLDNIRVYPNPAFVGQTITFAQLTAGKEKTIKIYTISGELVAEFSSLLDDVPWAIPTDLASGIYLYLINDHAGSIKQGKIGIIK